MVIMLNLFYKLNFKNIKRQNSFNLLIEISAMLRTNQFIQAEILSILNKTDIQVEKDKIFKMRKEIQDTVRADLFDQTNPNNIL